MEDILLSHSGKQHSYKVAISLQKIRRLHKFITSSYYDPNRFPDKLIPRIINLDRILKKRHENGLSDKVKRFPFFEMPELAVKAFFGNSKFTFNAVYLRDILFDLFVAKSQIRDIKIFWGFQGSCLESLKKAKRKGITAVIELATGHVTAAIKILEEEKNKNPDWADSISNLYFPDWYIRRLEEEPFIADYCLVASSFSKETLIDTGISTEKILELPLGVDIDKFAFRRRDAEGPFQILFVGGVGQRKGIKYLLDAVKLLNSDKIKLKIIGPIVGSGRAFKKYSEFYEYLGVLGQKDIVRHMHESDCLVLPSLFEGFGLVILEAMATGLPVIASPNSAAPDIIREGVDGFIVNPHDVYCLSEKINWMASNRKKINEMGESAAGRAREFSWDKYVIRLKKVLNTIEGRI